MFQSKYLKSHFSKNVLSLLTGTTLSQALPLITAPILARLYRPEDYGLFGIFLSTSTLLAVIATMEFSSGIIVAREESDAKSLVNISLILSACISTLLIIFIFLFKNSFASLFGAFNLRNYFLLTPVVIFLQSLNTVSSCVAIRKKLFKLIAINRVLTSVISASASIIVGLIYHSFWGLIVGYICGLLYSSLFLSIRVQNKSGVKLLGFTFNKIEFRETFRKFSKYPKFSLVSEFINNGINQMPVFLLGSLGSMSAVGYYNMNQRILGLPIFFVSNSFGEVFKQRASEDYHNHGSCRPILVKTLKFLLLVSIIPFSIIILWGDDIFAFFLGEKWRNAGVYTQALGLMFFFRFIANPISYVYVIAGNLKGDLLNHIYFFISSGLLLYFLIPKSVSLALFAYSLNYSFIYLFVLYRSYKLSINNEFRLNVV